MTVFKKTFFSLGIAAAGFSVVLVVFSLVFMNYLYYEINTKALKNTAKTLFAAVGKDNIIQVFKEHSDSLLVEDFGEHRLTLIDPSGFVLLDSHVTDSLVNHIDREEVESALQGKEASARRNSITRGNKEIYYALPVFNTGEAGGRVIGIFRLSVSVPSFGARVSPFILPFVIYSCLLAVIVFWTIFIYSRSLAESVGRLVVIAQSSTPLLSGPEAEEHIAPEFRSLEKAMRAMTAELNMRFELAKAEGKRLQAILNGMSEAVFAMDSNLKLHLVNPYAKKLFNIGNEKLTLLEATRSTELEDIAKKALVADTPLEMELTLRTGNAAGAVTEQYFQVFAVNLENSAGAASAVVLVLQDITRLVKLERIRKDFVANVSHELRTPIQLIKGFSETLAEAVYDNALAANENDKNKILHFIEIIQKNAANMENLTNDLLILANLENNEINALHSNAQKKEEIFVLPLIEEAVSSVKPQAERKNIEIIINCSEKIKAGLYGSLIIQALINLIDNAIKYSAPNSKIWVNAGFFENEQELIMEVRDNGIGIPKEHIERIFERFYRVDKARSKEAGGTGLGLSIVKHIALLHEGKAEAESSFTGEFTGAGGGSIFRIRIP